jgi:hypothetical protein
VPTFNSFLGRRRIDVDIDRIARLMVQKNVDPHWYIRKYLEAMDSEDGLICEGWLGNFFKRIGNAWAAFWKDPNRGDQVLNRLEDAKKALGDLVQMIQQNQGAETGMLGTVLRGLEQSLAILDKVEPTIKQYEPRISQMQAAQKGGQPAPSFVSDPSTQLPQDQQQHFMSIMQTRDQIIKMPDSEDKLHKLLVNDDELLRFRQGLEDMYQTINPQDENQKQYKDQIKNWLTHIDNDTAFREIQNLLDAAKRRTRTNLSVQRPQGYEQAVFAWRNIVAKTQDPAQQKQQLIQWYMALPQNHPVRAFILNDIQENPELGTEGELFWKYAQEWINKLPHYLASR